MGMEISRHAKSPSRGEFVPLEKVLLKMLFLFPRWDMLVPRRVCLLILFWEIQGRWLSEQSWSSWKYPLVGYMTPRWPEAIPSRTIATMLGHGGFHICVNRIPKFPKSDEYRCDGSHLETVDPEKASRNLKNPVVFEFCWNYTSPQTNISSENQWLEDVWRWNFHTFPLKWCPFLGGPC